MTTARNPRESEGERAVVRSGRHCTEPARFSIDTLKVIAPAPARALKEMVLDRYGNYVVAFDTDTDTVPVFTALGQWVGEAKSPDAIGTLIEIHERVNGGDA